ncbi:MAG: EcoRV family type II restriction endonuclease [Acidobacteria bacterium]|nr:EcoRV family type II restriction endonuclease [Acidobacteriota bacterium]MBI3428403.1 EcoRV family type II restriction endonuclease [Acidobacteriota bacterium]
MENKNAAAQFLELLQQEAERFNSSEMMSTPDGGWTVKGFIDVFRNVYTISGDTKVVSKLIELMLFPHFLAFADKHNLKVIPAPEQNYYPDLTFVDNAGRKFALDLKSAYRIDENTVSGMTLGAFTGYFRERRSAKNITFPYGEYAGHFVLGVIYTRVAIRPDEFRSHTLDELEEIPSVVKDLRFFVQPKYRIALDRPGSGNTKNIGAVGKTAALVNGNGPFTDLGEEIFDDYWMFYLTSDMARKAELPKPPYNNLPSYFAFKQPPAKSGGDE